MSTARKLWDGEPGPRGCILPAARQAAGTVKAGQVMHVTLHAPRAVAAGLTRQRGWADAADRRVLGYAALRTLAVLTAAILPFPALVALAGAALIVGSLVVSVWAVGFAALFLLTADFL